VKEGVDEENENGNLAEIHGRANNAIQTKQNS
jgi:hypothetical protein